MRTSFFKPIILSAALAAGLVGLAAAGSAHAAPSAPAPTPTPTPAPASSFRQPIHFPGPITIVNPILTSVEGVAEVAPGGLVKVDGLNLGERAGASLCMRWSLIVVDNAFTRNGRECLQIIDWQPTRVIASVPEDLVGVPDETAHLVAIRGDGETSTTVDIKFVATRETVRVDSAGVSVVCSQAASDDNNCSTDGAIHRNGICCSTEDAVGSVGDDVYILRLKNGWTVTNVSLFTTEGDASISNQTVIGRANGHVTVFWSAGGFRGGVDYAVFIMAIGPKGVPLG